MLVGLLGILIALGLLMWFSFRGWSILLLARAAALLAALRRSLCLEPPLARFEQTAFASTSSELRTQWCPSLLGDVVTDAVDAAPVVETNLTGPCSSRRRRMRQSAPAPIRGANLPSRAGRGLQVPAPADRADARAAAGASDPRTACRCGSRRTIAPPARSS
jgi:hypothetical protein